MAQRPLSSIFVLLLCMASGSRASGDDAGGTVLRGKQVALAHPPAHQLRDRPTGLQVDSTLVLGGQRFATEMRRGRLHVATRPGARAAQAVRAGQPIRFQVGARKLPIVFRPRDDGTWRCHAGWALGFRLDGVDVRFVDLDVDGQIDAQDGILLHGSAVALPWADTVDLLTKRVRILALDTAAIALRVTLADLPGTPLQQRALALLNIERARFGLAPASLDADLSAACTAHARYLARNGLEVSGDPHTQDPNLPGASAEGAKAAARSVIAPSAADAAMRRFLTTYYHRVGPCHPDLEAVGVNADAPQLAVVDVTQAYERRRANGNLWSDVICVPCDGAVGVTTYATGEKPKEPVPDLGSRGSPLIVYFRERLPAVEAFAGVLVRLTKTGSEPVETLVAAQGGLPFAFGIVPAERLRGETWYEATFTYRYDGRAGRKQVRFRTGTTPKRR